MLLVQYGRGSLGDITREVDGKSEEEVRAYSKTFWRRYKELTDWERVIKNIGARPSASWPPDSGVRCSQTQIPAVLALSKCQIAHIPGKIVTDVAILETCSPGRMLGSRHA